MILVADTSGTVAASDSRAPEGAACRRILGQAGTVVVPPLVPAEVDHVAGARFGSTARDVLTLDRRDFRTIRPFTPHDAFVVLPDDEQ
ncbi:MAG: hypothetical protein ACFCVG_02435 [Kineosporiaceae bacterium]